MKAVSRESSVTMDAMRRAGGTGGRITKIARGMGFGLLTLLVAPVFIASNAGVGGTPRATLPDCLVSPAYDPGVGELYFCSPERGEQRLIEYVRRSFIDEGFEEDIWVNFRGVFDNQVWINVGTRETNDTSLPAWEVITVVGERMRAIKAGDPSALQAFLAPIETTPALTEEDRTLKRRLIEALRQSAMAPADAPLRAVLYHVHLRPTREIEERSLMPINHWLSIPSHTDLLYTARLSASTPGAEAKIAVAAGIWTYDWNETQGAHFVMKRYDEPASIPFPLKFAHTYTRFAITEYHRQGLNDPSAVTPEQVARYIATLRSAGAVLRFDFASDWEVVRGSLERADEDE